MVDSIGTKKLTPVSKSKSVTRARIDKSPQQQKNNRSDEDQNTKSKERLGGSIDERC